MQIALCDDETAYYETLQSLIREYKLMKSELPLSLSSFCSGRELLNHVDAHGSFDLYILDCIMPEMDGIETGCALRERDDVVPVKTPGSICPMSKKSKKNDLILTVMVNLFCNTFG